MKKGFYAVVAAILLTALLPTGALATSTGAASYIGEAKAQSIALEDAGVSEEEATSLRVHLDREDGHVVYDVEFYSGNTEYDYEIDAVSGEIYEWDRETEHRSMPRPASSASADAASYIGEAKAKSIALSDAGLTESQVRKMKVKLDREHGTMVYEVEFKSGRMEYEVEIDASSGAILESDVEEDD